jgi:hypothetical protein
MTMRGGGTAWAAEVAGGVVVFGFCCAEDNPAKAHAQASKTATVLALRLIFMGVPLACHPDEQVACGTEPTS